MRAYFTPVERSFIIHKVYEIKERLGVIRGIRGKVAHYRINDQNAVAAKCPPKQIKLAQHLVEGDQVVKKQFAFFGQSGDFEGGCFGCFLASDDSDRAAFAAYL